MRARVHVRVPRGPRGRAARTWDPFFPKRTRTPQQSTHPAASSAGSAKLKVLATYEGSQGAQRTHAGVRCARFRAAADSADAAERLGAARPPAR
eukprot:12392831-Alexandrium_andersonii.AAC.1